MNKYPFHILSVNGWILQQHLMLFRGAPGLGAWIDVNFGKKKWVGPEESADLPFGWLFTSTNVRKSSITVFLAEFDTLLALPCFVCGYLTSTTVAWPPPQLKWWYHIIRHDYVLSKLLLFLHPVVEMTEAQVEELSLDLSLACQPVLSWRCQSNMNTWHYNTNNFPSNWKHLTVCIRSAFLDLGKAVHLGAGVICFRFFNSVPWWIVLLNVSAYCHSIRWHWLQIPELIRHCCPELLWRQGRMYVHIGVLLRPHSNSYDLFLASLSLSSAFHYSNTTGIHTVTREVYLIC